LIINLAGTVGKQTLRFVSTEALFYRNRGSVSGKQNVCLRRIYTSFR